MDVAVHIKLQQVSGVIARLARSARCLRVAKPQLLQVERIDKGVNRTNRIIAINIVFHPRRQKTGLLPADTGLEGVIRHKTNRTPECEFRESGL